MPATIYVQSRLGELLTAATAGLTLARTGNAIPSHTIITHGPPSVDLCNDNGLLAVYLDSPAIGDNAPVARIAENAGPLKRMPVLRMCIELWRCVPNISSDGDPPTDANLTASADGLANDLWALDTYLRANKATLFPTGLAGTVIPSFSDPVPRNPSGNVGGWLWKVQVPISDGGP